MSELLRKFRIVTVIFAVCYFAVGGLMLFAPTVATSIICYLVGAAIMISGGAKAITSIINKDESITNGIGLIFGIIAFIAGLYIVLRPQAVMSFIFFIVGIALTVSGASKVGMAFDVKRSGHARWWIELVFAVIIIAGGVVLMLMPREGNVLMQIIGGVLLINGILNLANLFYLLRAEKEFQNIFDRTAKSTSSSADDDVIITSGEEVDDDK